MGSQHLYLYYPDNVDIFTTAILDFAQRENYAVIFTYREEFFTLMTATIDVQDRFRLIIVITTAGIFFCLLIQSYPIKESCRCRLRKRLQNRIS